MFDLDPQKAEKVSALKTFIIHKDQSFAHFLLYCPVLVLEKDVVAFTDGVCVFVGQKFFTYTEKEQLGIIIHEILHIALRHIPRAKALHVNMKGWNIAADLVINWGVNKLKWAKIPKDGLSFNTSPLKFLKDYSELTVEEVYTALVKYSEENQSEMEPSDDGSGEGNGDLQPGAIEGKAAKAGGDERVKEAYAGGDEGEEQEEEKWAKRQEVAKQQGNSPDSIVSNLINDIKKVGNIPWFKIFKPLMLNTLSDKRITNYGRQSRRLEGRVTDMFIPATKKEKTIKQIAAIVDTSGSMFNEEDLQMAFDHIADIQKQTNAELLLIFADAAVQGVITITPETTIEKELKAGRLLPKGGGGTSFVPALDHLKKRPPTVCVYITDLYGEFPAASPKFPLIWLSQTTGVSVPFGKLITTT
jgi:predicted metal-dependent peptidase